MVEFKVLKFNKISLLVAIPLIVLVFTFSDSLENLLPQVVFELLMIFSIMLVMSVAELVLSNPKLSSIVALCEYNTDKNEFTIQIGKKKYNFTTFDEVTLKKSYIYYFMPNVTLDIWVDKKTLISITGIKIKRKQSIEESDLYNVYNFIKTNYNDHIEKINTKDKYVIVSKQYEKEYDNIQNAPATWKDYLFLVLSFAIPLAFGLWLLKYNITIVGGIVSLIWCLFSAIVFVKMLLERN